MGIDIVKYVCIEAVPYRRIYKMIDLSKVTNIILNHSIDAAEIETLEREMNVNLPKVYRDLLKYTNGFSIDGGLTIYGTMNIIERNLTWEVDGYAKGYVAIGDDGGGNVFLMHQGSEAKDVFTVDSGDMNPGNARKLTSDFTRWVSEGCINKSEDKSINQISHDICDLVLVNTLSGGAKDLIQIKNIIGLEISMGELLKGSKKPPFVLVKDFPYGKARKLIEKLGSIGKDITLVPSDVGK